MKELAETLPLIDTAYAKGRGNSIQITASEGVQNPALVH